MIEIGLSSNIFGTIDVCMALERMAKIGIPVIELHALHMNQLQYENIAKVKTVLENKGLQVHSVHSPTMSAGFIGKSDQKFDERYTDFYGPLFDFANQLGARIFIDHVEKADKKLPGDYLQYERKIVIAYKKLTDLANKYGIVVAVENNSRDGALRTPEQILRLIKAVGMTSFKYNLDIGHAICNKITPADFVKILGDYIVNVHTGNFEIGTLVKMLGKKKYKGKIILEYEEYNLREAFSCMVEHLKGLGLLDEHRTQNIDITAVPVKNNMRVPRVINNKKRNVLR